MKQHFWLGSSFRPRILAFLNREIPGKALFGHQRLGLDRCFSLRPEGMLKPCADPMLSGPRFPCSFALWTPFLVAADVWALVWGRVAQNVPHKAG
jgi:hypothetical protein